jgi:imidazoleglycerol-phosphate dehydratase
MGRPVLLRVYSQLIDMAARTATISRKTNETQIDVSINLDCTPGSQSAQVIEISTGIGFLDHV